MSVDAEGYVSDERTTPFLVDDDCPHCERGHHCSYHEGWLDALDVHRVSELLEVSRWAQVAANLESCRCPLPSPHGVCSVCRLRASLSSLHAA